MSKAADRDDSKTWVSIGGGVCIFVHLCNTAFRKSASVAGLIFLCIQHNTVFVVIFLLFLLSFLPLLISFLNHYVPNFLLCLIFYCLSHFSISSPPSVHHPKLSTSPSTLQRFNSLCHQFTYCVQLKNTTVTINDSTGIR